MEIIVFILFQYFFINAILVNRKAENSMNKRTMLIVPILLSFSLSSCGEVYKYEEHLEDYVYAMKYHDNFNILQLTDIHWNYNSSTLSSRSYLEKVIKEADAHIKATQTPTSKIDLIELTGDQFMLANSYHVNTFISFFEEKSEEYGFMYTAIWGNHDRHGLYNPNWVGQKFREAKNSIYIEPEDNLYGRSNFVINLTDDGTKEAITKWQIANLDSGASFSETAISPFRDYDYIRDDQVDWWKKEHDLVGATVPTVAYYHIPQQDNMEAWNKIHKDGATYKHKFFKLEGFADNGTGNYNSKFIETGRTNGLKAAFMGHAHNVDWTVDYDGVVLGLGVKTGPELYYAHIDPADSDEFVQEGLNSLGGAINEKFDLIGASLMTLQNGDAFELEHLYLNERANEDFVKWVNW